MVDPNKLALKFVAELALCAPPPIPGEQVVAISFTLDALLILLTAVAVAAQTEPNSAGRES